MNGSEKQVKWAEDIKQDKADEFAQLKERFGKSAAALKAIEYIEGNEHAAFWIDHRNSSVMEILDSLMRGGVQVKGHNFDHRATMTPDGTITVTWSEIVQDGKGGHKATRQVAI